MTPSASDDGGDAYGAAKSPEAIERTKEKKEDEQDAGEVDGTDMWRCPACTFKNSPLLPNCEICKARKAPEPAGRAEKIKDVRRAIRESAANKRKRINEQNPEKARNVETEAKKTRKVAIEDRLRRSEGKIRSNDGKANIQKQGTICCILVAIG